MTTARFVLILLAGLLSAPAPAQQPADLLSATEVERIRVEKKAWVGLNMQLTAPEADVFWPVYDAYQKELQQINLRLIRMVESYGVSYRNNTLTDEIARKLTEESFAVDESELKLRRSYYARLAKVLPATKAARYLQLESRVHIQVRYELAANLPLAGDARPTILRAPK